MDEYTIEEMKYKNGLEEGRRQGDAVGYARGLAVASARNVPESIYPDGDIDTPECPRCGSGEYLENADGNRNKFCGQCGQALDWTEPED